MVKNPWWATQTHQIRDQLLMLNRQPNTLRRNEGKRLTHRTLEFEKLATMRKTLSLVSFIFLASNGSVDAI